MMENYLHTYVDRRMEILIEEWQLARKDEISDIALRVEALEQDIPQRKISQREILERITALEKRALRISELKR
jgi:polyhydroxyalkanoate synthesis regulator phasin